MLVWSRILRVAAAAQVETHERVERVVPAVSQPFVAREGVVGDEAGVEAGLLGGDGPSRPRPRRWQTRRTPRRGGSGAGA